MKRRMTIMLIGLAVLFGVVIIYKVFISYMVKHFIAANSNPIVTVSAAKVSYSEWEPLIKAVGSLRALQGVNVTTELAGMVQTIYFKPGDFVQGGTTLVQLNADADVAQLHALEANAELARITYERDKKQFAIKAISKQTLDTDYENLKNARAQVAQQAANVAKKTIRAPFTGRLGVSAVNLGQYLKPGDKVVAIETLNPIWADFNVPQQQLATLKLNQLVSVLSDSFPDKRFKGNVTTIEPAVDVNTRNVLIEATIANPDMELKPGMFTNIVVVTGDAKKFLTLPQTAVSFNPYGELVFIVNESGKDNTGKPQLTVVQSFITTGETRGNQVQILKGLKEGDLVVTSGQLKLKNGSRVVINNSVVPPDAASPNVGIEG